jgi:hypothetical protein
VLDLIEKKALEAGYIILKHHWNRYQPRHVAHKRVLKDQLDSARLQEMSGRKVLILWNRSQASEAIYSKLLGRKSGLADNPLLGEYLYGRVQMTLGPRVILLGPDLATVRSLRDDTDHKVDPEAEREAYREYGTRYGWTVLENEHTLAYADNLATKLIHNVLLRPEVDITTYAGPLQPKVLFLHKGNSGDWAPFSSPNLVSQYLEAGPRILEYGYATTETNRQLLMGAEKVVLASQLQPFTRTFARYYLGYREDQLAIAKEFINEPQ